MFAIVTSRHQICRLLMLGLLGSCVWWCKGQSSALADHQQQILVIHSYHDQLPWTHGLRTGISQGFQEQSDEVNVYHEFLDAKRLPELRHGEAFLKELTLKYPETSLDLLIVSDDPGLNLVLNHRADFFSTLPIVYLGINTVEPALLNEPNTTGVFENHNIVETVMGALEQTDSQTIIIINDSTETGKANLNNLENLRRHPKAPKSMIVLNDIVESSVSQILYKYPPDCPILILGQLRQERPDGALASFKDTAEALREALPNPLYVVSSTFLGHGVIGGKVLDSEYHAQQAVELAHQVLGQNEATGITPITKAKARWVFDQRELTRLGISVRDLPPDSKVIHQELSFYDQYKQLVWITFSTQIDLKIVPAKFQVGSSLSKAVTEQRFRASIQGML